MRQQGVRRLDHDLAHDEQVRIEEVVERVRDQPLARLLDRDHAVVGPPPHRPEHLAEARRRQVARRQTEAGLPRQVAEGRLRPRVGDDERALEREASRHDLPEHRPHRLAREGAVRRRGQPLEHDALAPRHVERLAAAALDLPDLLDHLGAPIEQRQDLIVQAIDLDAQLGETRSRTGSRLSQWSCRRSR
jgi:hypothetical protein